MTDKLSDMFKEINDLLDAVSKEEYRDKKDYSVLEGMERDSVNKIRTAFDKGYKQGYEVGVASQGFTEGYTEEEVKKREKEVEKKCIEQMKVLMDNAKSDAEANEKRVYQEGLDKAWDTMRKILNGFSFYETEVFKTKYYPDIIKNYSASEAIYKIEAFEAKQRKMKENDCEHCSKEYGTLGCCSTVNNEWIYSCEEGHKEYRQRAEINVGDEVIHEGTRVIITNVNDEWISGIEAQDGSAHCDFNKTDCVKTGRHFSEISKIFEALKEGDPE